MVKIISIKILAPIAIFPAPAIVHCAEVAEHETYVDNEHYDGKVKHVDERCSQ
jgi:hypothetical protein